MTTGSRTVLNGFADRQRNEEVLERSVVEKPVETALGGCFGERSSVQIRPAPSLNNVTESSKKVNIALIVWDVENWVLVSLK